MGDREAGREMDERVAIEVMGWGWCMPESGPRAGWVTFASLLPPDSPDKRVVVAEDDVRLMQCERDVLAVPHYSTDIAAAWLVVEAMQTFNEDGYHAVLKTPFTLGNAYIAGFTPHGVTGWNGAPDFVGFATTAPHAICLAALKVATAPRETVQGDETTK